MVSSVCDYVTKWSTSWLKRYTYDTWHQYAQGYFPLAYFHVNTCHLLIVCSIISPNTKLSSQVSIISSIPMCYTTCHSVNMFSLMKLLMMMNGIILAISRGDT